MKILNLYLIIGFLILFVCAHSQVTVNSSGKVGINNSSPSYDFDVSGNFNLEQTGASRIVTQNGKRIIFDNSDMYTDNNANLGVYSYCCMWLYLYTEYATFTYNPTIISDKNMKKDIKNLDKTLSKLISLRPVKYKMKPKIKNNETPAENKPQVGLIAQEVQNIFPEVVSQVGDSHLGIRYTELVPMLIRALQEQQEKIKKLRDKTEYYEQNTALKSSTLKNIGLEDAKIYHSKSNSGKGLITIDYQIPTSINNAQLYICNTNGKLLKKSTIDTYGRGSVSISANELENGKVLYCLVCDGSIVDTKQLMLKN